MDQPGPVLEAETERIEHAVDMALGTRAALHGEAWRLVEDDDVIVLVDHQRLDLGGVAIGDGGDFARASAAAPT